MIRRIAFCLAASCAAQSLADEPATPLAISTDVKAAAKANNDFAVNLYSKLRTQQTGNICISPFSVFTALTMTSAGARGDTASEMQKALQLRLIAKTVPDSLAELRRRLQESERDGNCQLKIANQLWARSGFDCLPDFQSTLQKNYGAELVQLDFSQPATASRTMNNWVNENTNGKIPDLISPQALGDDAQLVLANAIYFKAKWEDEFKKESTRPEPFHLSAKDQVEVPFMHQTNDFKFGSVHSTAGDELQILRLPYKGNELSLIIVLPEAHDGLEKLENQLSSRLPLWLAKLSMEKVRVSLPKFKHMFSAELSDTLQSLGMKSAFLTEADFSGINRKNPVCLSKVFHKTFIDVGEEGTEAAAATAVIMPPAAAPHQEILKEQIFNADHPFLYLIRHDASGCILFIGRVTDPRI